MESNTLWWGLYFNWIWEEVFISTDILDTRADSFYTDPNMTECELATKDVIESITRYVLEDVSSEDERVTKPAFFLY